MSEVFDILIHRSYAILFAVMMMGGGFYVLKLSRLSKAWKWVWTFFTIFIFLIVGSKIALEFTYAEPPKEPLQWAFRLWFPSLGAIFFFLAFKRLYEIFSKFMWADGKEKDVMGKVGDKQYKIVMDTFGRGKLRSSNGKTVTDPRQAQAIARSESEAADERGVSKRTWRGRTRIRPNKAR